MKMTQLNKRWYFPGLISLIGLFPLCYGYINWRGFLKANYVIPVLVLDKDMEYSWLSSKGWYSKTSNYQVHYFTVGGNPIGNTETMEQIDSLIHKIIVSADTINRIAIHLSASANYQSFIRLFDLRKRNRVERQYFNRYDYLIWYENEGIRDSLPDIPVCGTYQIMAEKRKALLKQQKDATTLASHIAIAKVLVLPLLILIIGIMLKFIFRK
jgi:hypothetical protein